MGGYSRGNPAMGDVLRSVLVLGAVVLGLWLFGQLLTQTPDKPTSDADWRTAASGVEGRAGFAPLVPDELPEGWRATRAELIDTRWQLNLVTQDDEFVGLSQVPGDAKSLRTLIADRAPDGKPDGTVPIGGDEWQLLTAGDETTFARVVGRQAVVVTGTAPRAVMQDYIASLEPYSS
ncbi:DUF4245 domain-containing protein [Aeromicrobium sp. 179-A 4D2 NHS]|uniref:DUF4245 domain-containing protein n=1 Tax=Aeromicrobium sp. 179-A 4D2 NHS TaxID=3142375 RepID=UPI0039A16B9A